MKNKLILLVFALIFISGCEDTFLDTVPTNSISSGAALSSPDNMMLVLNGLHRQMYAQNPLEGYQYGSASGESYWIPAFDAIGGGIILATTANGWLVSEARWDSHTIETDFNVEALWFQRYHFIASANSIINAIEGGEFSTDDPEIRNILGQAYAYRAWSYWRLVTTYAKGYIIGNPASDPGVPILLQRGAPYEGAPRSTVEEVYTQIETDIDKAITYLRNGSNPGSGSSAKSHISVDAAYGIKARVALSKGDWQVAADNAALARANYPLMTESEWLSGFNTLGLPEVIWGGHVTDTETNYFRSYFYLVSPTFNGSQNRANPKLIDKRVYDQIPATDYRRKAWLPQAPNTNPAASNGEGGSAATDPNYDNQQEFVDSLNAIRTRYGLTNRHNTHPYMNVKFLQKAPGTIDPDDVIYMRSSEMVLIEAEAYAMLDQPLNARAALLMLGSARDTDYATRLATILDADLMDEVKFQRKVELWGEGFTYHDFIRWDEELDLTGSGASQVLYQDGFQQAKPSVNDDWIWKIPQDEINANPFITDANQN